MEELLKNLFKERNNLHAPDGRSLFRYRISEIEYQILKKALIENSKRSQESIWWNVFMLYACEYWRREFIGGAWSWEVIFNSLDLTPPNKDYQFYNKIALGLKFWNRPILIVNANKRYLGTIVINSGIPSFALDQDGNKIGLLIERVYKETRSIAFSENEIIDRVRGIAENLRLPQSLQDDGFYALIAEITENLIQLNAKYSLNNQNSPLAYLDNVDNSWRQQFPLQLDSAQRIGFFNELLSNVAKQNNLPKYKIKIEHKLVDFDRQPHLKTTLIFPDGRYSFEELGISEESASQFTGKALLMLQSDNEERIPIGFGFKTDIQFQINGVNTKALSSVPDASLKTWQLWLLDSKNNYEFRIPLPNSDALNQDQPLVFVEKDNSWILAGIGSRSLSQGQVKVICSNEFKIECNQFNMNEGDEYKLLTLNSDCTLSKGEDIYKIKLGCQKNDNYEFSLIGHTMPYYNEDNKNVFIGIPSIVKFDYENSNRTNVWDGIKVRSKGNIWEPKQGDETGRLSLRVEDKDGAILFQKRINVLPIATNFNLGGSKVSANITIKGLDRWDLAVDTQGFEGEIKNAADEKVIHLNYDEGIPPEKVSIRVNPPNAVAFSVTLPYPHNGIKVYKPDGAVLQNEETIYMSKLHGYRLVYYNNSPNDRDLRVKAEVYNPHNNQETANDTIRINVKKYDQLRKPLIDFTNTIQGLINYVHTIDAEVQLSIDNLRLHIKQYPMEGKFDIENKSFHIPNQTKSPLKVEVKALRFDLPIKSESILQFQYVPETDCWVAPAEFEEKGLWLIYPGKETEKEVFFRPDLVGYFENRDGVLEIDQIKDAALIQGYTTRVAAIKDFFDRMANDFNNPVWLELQTLFEQTGHLPMTIFNVWTGLVESQKGIVSAFINLSPEAFRKLLREYPINLYHVPIFAWIDIFKCFYKFLSSISTVSAFQVIDSKIKQLQEEYRLYNLGEVLASEINGNNQQNYPIEIIQFRFGQLLNGEEGKPGLIGRNASDEIEWPVFRRGELTQIFNSLPEENKMVIPDGLIGFYKPIIYLPIILALQTVNPSLVNLPIITVKQKHEINKMIDFDRQWFEEAFNLAQGYYWTILKN